MFLPVNSAADRVNGPISDFENGKGARAFSDTSGFYVVVVLCPLLIVVLGAAAAYLHLRLVRHRRLLREKLDQSTPAHQALLPSSGTGAGQHASGSAGGHDAAGPSGMSTTASGRRSGQRKSHRHHKDSKVDG